jgi:uncharacterized phage infection (PIP) family protein YhgE
MARIAAAKAYKQSSDAGSNAAPSPPQASSEPTTSSSDSEATSSLSEQQQEAMRQQYLQQLREQQASVASQSSEYSAYIQQTAQQASSSAANALDRLQEEDRDPGERPAPARPDFYTNPEVPSVQQLMSTAPKKAGTGSADEAADWLAGVLQERPGEYCFW